MKEQLTAIEAHQKIEAIAETCIQADRDCQGIQEGQVVRQGDIYIHCVSANHPHGKELESRQLAIGSQLGARHMTGEGARLFEGTTRPKWFTGQFMGPCIIADKPVRISHPEHAPLVLPVGTYQVSHQTDARTLDRVRD
jgi:hypothetical protein